MTTNAERQRAYRQRAAEALRRAKNDSAPTAPAPLRNAPPTLPALLAAARISTSEKDGDPLTDTGEIAEDVADAVGYILFVLGILPPVPFDSPEVIASSYRENAEFMIDASVKPVIEMLGGTDYCVAVLKYRGASNVKHNRKSRDAISHALQFQSRRSRAARQDKIPHIS
jgi:hypothetical protein